MAKAKGGSTRALRLGRQSFCHSPFLKPREDKRSLPTTPADINHGEDFGLRASPPFPLKEPLRPPAEARRQNCSGAPKTQDTLASSS
jgi:hypothetical protein